MPELETVPVAKLSLDLANFRTTHQPDEHAAIRALIAVETEWFWALTESLLDDGYLPTESVVVLRAGKRLVVKEGNRRVAALKLILGLVPAGEFAVPEALEKRLISVSAKWRAANKNVPCTVFPSSDEPLVDRIVTLTHGKNEKAGRAKWNAVARSRHNRDKNGSAEPGLDALEVYLKTGQNVSAKQRERWAGDFPLTVVDEALKRLAPRLGKKSSAEVSQSLPFKGTHRQAFELLMHGIGLEEFGFKELRAENPDLLGSLGFPVATAKSPGEGAAPKGKDKVQDDGSPPSGGAVDPPDASNPPTKKPKPALATDDPKFVAECLKNFKPAGKGREKVVTLLNEIRTIQLGKQPHAFCFLLRSMFELSAKAYCKDGPGKLIKQHDSSGNDRKLVDLLRDIVKQLTMNGTNKAKQKELHGAMATLADKDSFLSVTSLNQLVHNPKFSVKAGDVANLFSNVFPLLEELNA